MERNLKRLKSERLEYILMAGIIVPVVFSVLLFSGDVDMVFWMRCISRLSVGALVLYYLIASEKQLLSTIAFLCVGAAALAGLGMNNAGWQVYIQAAPYAVTAVFVIGMCIRHSRTYRSFEIMEGLLGLFLLVAALRFFVEIEAVSNYYSFGICFLIATLMYNSNMWDRYISSEQNLLLLLLVVSLTDVILMSAKFI